MGEAATLAVVACLVQSKVSTQSSFIIGWRGLGELLWVINLILDSHRLVQPKLVGLEKRQE